MERRIALLVLVKSLSKSEKRQIKLHCNLQSGDKVYLTLFDILEEARSIEQVYERFCISNEGRNFEVAVKHLYGVILDCLAHLREKQDIQSRIFGLISKAEIMFERSLVDESLATLAKARKMATHYEHDTLLLLIRRIELKYLSATDFVGITEKRLVDKQMRINEALKYTRSATQHMQLYDILKYRIMYSGYARTDRQKHNLNDLVMSELNMVANISHKGFETQKLSLLFQATYFLNTGEYTTALRFYAQLIDIFEQHRDKMQNPPIHYLNTVIGIIESLQVTELYAEMPFFISKLKLIGLGGYSTEFTHSVNAQVYLYELSQALNLGNIDEAKQLRATYDERLFRKSSLQGLDIQLLLYLSEVKLFIYIGDSGEARRSMRKILSSGKSLYNFPAYKVARLLNLILHCDLGDDNFIENEVKSIRRNIHTERNVYQYNTERLFFKFIRICPLVRDKKERATLWNRYKKEIREIRSNKYERPLLKDFDFLLWIESQFSDKTMGEMLTESKMIVK